MTVYSQITGTGDGRFITPKARWCRKAIRWWTSIRARIEATLTQAEGNLEHDQGVLAQARMDLKRYQAAYARNAIAKQQLDDQEQAVVQDEGTVKADQGTVAYDRCSLAIATSSRRSAGGSGCGWWTRETPFFRAAAPRWW